jgi:hypothetical protein
LRSLLELRGKIMNPFRDPRHILCGVFLWAAVQLLLWADDPTSMYVALSPIPSLLPAGASGNAVQFEIWDQASGGNQITTEAHTVDTDGGSNISNDSGLPNLLLGRPGGLNPASPARLPTSVRSPIFASRQQPRSPYEPTTLLPEASSTPHSSYSFSRRMRAARHEFAV